MKKGRDYMVVPKIVKDITKGSLCENNYFTMYENMMASLERVVRGEDTYSSYHYSIMINCLEICMKGLLFDYKTSGRWREPHPNFLTEDHKLYKLVVQIRNVHPSFLYCKTTKDEHDLRQFLCDLGKQYTFARYYEQVPFEDFASLHSDFFKPVTEKVCEYAGRKERAVEIEFADGL